MAITSNERDAAVLADCLLQFMVKCEVHKPDTLQLALDYLWQQTQNESEIVHKFMHAVREFIQENQP